MIEKEHVEIDKKRNLKELSERQDKEKVEKKEERKEKQRKLQEKWEMLRWITTYLEKNIERWEKEREERKGENEKKIADWEKKSRFEKIRKIRENQNEIKVNESDKCSGGSQPSLRVMRCQLSPRSLQQENLKACKPAGGGREDEEGGWPAQPMGDEVPAAPQDSPADRGEGGGASPA